MFNSKNNKIMNELIIKSKSDETEAVVAVAREIEKLVF